MTEPTIDEMLELLNEVSLEHYGNDLHILNAIRAILEQHRNQPSVAEMADYFADQLKLEHIRAFVERVSKRIDEGYRNDVWVVVKDELAALEKESQ